MHRIYLSTLLIVVCLGSAAWATDFITLQGEWTVYTASCEHGAWQGTACSGRIAPSARYRFRALKAHREVLFWTSGERAQSGRYTQCSIQDGRNWSCPPNDDAPRTITHAMESGKAKPDPDAHSIEFHQIPKWKWELSSLRAFSDGKGSN